MDNNPKVSILIPAYNREKMIGKAIKSAISQTYKNIEIIIVDNDSTDNTYFICKEFEKKDDRIKVYRNNENIGPVRNWIECLKYSTGDYIKFLWSDDWIDDDFIEKTVDLLKNKEIAFVYSPSYIIDEINKENKLVYNLFKKDKIYNSELFIKKAIFGGNVPVSPGCAIFRREDVKENLLIDIPNEDNLDFSRFGAGNDLLLFLLSTIKHNKVAYVNSTKSFFRAHKGSFSCSQNLNLYYDWAKLYYLNIKNNRRLIRMFKAKIILKSILNEDYEKDYKNINKSIKCKINLVDIFSIIFYRLTTKIKNKN